MAAGFVTPQVICSALNVTPVQCKVRRCCCHLSRIGFPPGQIGPLLLAALSMLGVPQAALRCSWPQVLVDLLAAVVEPADLVQRNEGEAGH